MIPRTALALAVCVTTTLVGTHSRASPPVPPPTNLTLEAGQTGGLTLVFVPHEQPSEAAFQTAISDVRHTLETTPAFGRATTAYYRLTPFAKAQTWCHVATEGEPRPWLRCDRALAAMLNNAGLPDGYKVVVLSTAAIPARANVSRAGAASVVFLTAGDTSRARDAVIRHEFGHAFGLVDVRIVLAADHNSAARREGLNCRTKADALTAFTTGAAQAPRLRAGCAGDPTLWAPDEPDVMAGDSDDFGPVTARLLQDVLRAAYAPRPQ